MLAATILASAMAFIDGSIVTIALPTLQSDLDASFSALQWVVNAYALLLGGLILIGGGAGDRFGRKRVFIAGIAVFALASLACAAAPDALSLILARAAQGIGAALLVPQSLAIIAASFPKEVRGRAIGIWAGASAITTAMGPPLGGLLIDALDWRAVFWINLPLSAVAIWLALRHIPESRNEEASGALDWAGGVLAIVAFGAMTFGLTLLSEGDGAEVQMALLVGIGALALAAFVRIEARTANPLMPLTLFRSRAFTAANIMTLFLYGALSGVLFLLPFDLIQRRGLSATEVGLALLPIGIIIGVLSRISGRVADRIGVRWLLTWGALLVTAAIVVLALAFNDFWAGVLAPIVVLATGMAMVVAPLTTAVMNAADDTHAGAASGVNNAASRLAGLFAVAILGSIASLVFLTYGHLPGIVELTEGLARPDIDVRFGILPEPADPMRALFEAAFLSAYSSALWVAALWSALAAAISYLFLLSPKAGP